MTYLLLKSLQISYESDPAKTLIDIADELDVTIEELTKASEEFGIPVSTWSKPTTFKEPIVQELLPTITIDSSDTYSVDEVIVSEKPAPQQDIQPDIIRTNLDALTKDILAQARMRISENPDIETKELKDLTQIVQILENIKYPKPNARMGVEVDLQKGIVSFLAEVASND